MLFSSQKRIQINNDSAAFQYYQCESEPKRNKRASLKYHKTRIILHSNMTYQDIYTHDVQLREVQESMTLDVIHVKT